MKQILTKLDCGPVGVFGAGDSEAPGTEKLYSTETAVHLKQNGYDGSIVFENAKRSHPEPEVISPRFAPSAKPLIG